MRLVRRYRDGQPCDHPGCLHHVIDECEGCGRIAGIGEAKVVAYSYLQKRNGEDMAMSQAPVIPKKRFIPPRFVKFQPNQDDIFHLRINNREYYQVGMGGVTRISVSLEVCDTGQIVPWFVIWQGNKLESKWNAGKCIGVMFRDASTERKLLKVFITPTGKARDSDSEEGRKLNELVDEILSLGDSEEVNWVDEEDPDEDFDYVGTDVSEWPGGYWECTVEEQEFYRFLNQTGDLCHWQETLSEP